jgi:hypothetical protein
VRCPCRAAGTTGEAYARAVAALREDTRSYWLECLEDSSDDDPSCRPSAEGLEAWIRRHWTKWYEWPIAELEHRDAIREQAFGSAYGSQRLEGTARRLRELRRPPMSG